MRSFPPCAYYDAFLEIHENLDYERCCGLASETLINVCIKCRDELNIPIVALDVAGAEEGFENKVHKDAFDIAHANFFNKTVHAGEGFGPESIFQAIRDLHAERIGHGFHLFSAEKVTSLETQEDKDKYVQKLVKYVCDRRMNLEVCLTSNLGTMPGLSLENHAMRKMLEHGVSVSLNTDNRLVSDTTMVDEIAKAIEAFELTPKQLREIVLCGFKRSFFQGPYADKRKHVRVCMDTYDRLANEFRIEELYTEYKSADNKMP
jgi:adenosine deaminase